jgi:hypothetical protein
VVADARLRARKGPEEDLTKSECYVSRRSATLIPVLQLTALLGHAFTDAEDRPGAPPHRRRAVAHASCPCSSIFRTQRRSCGCRFSSTRSIPRPRRSPTTPSRALKPGVTVAEAERDFAAVLPRGARRRAALRPRHLDATDPGSGAPAACAGATPDRHRVRNHGDAVDRRGRCGAQLSSNAAGRSVCDSFYSHR